MTQEDKDLLLKDLSARLPYRVICTDGCHGSSVITDIDVSPMSDKATVYYFDFDEYGDIENCKPYLRPMSSMTKKELHEVQEILGNGIEIREAFILSIDSSINAFSYLELQAVFDWLSAHHFDYRGLIERGLALEAPEELNN